MIRNDIVAGLYGHLNRPIIPSPNAENRPGMPFIGYAVTSPYIAQGFGSETWEVVPSDDVSFESDILETLDLEPEATFSFTAYATTSVDALNTAKDAWNWFRLIGIDYLRSKGITVVEVMNIQNRDLLEVDEYTMREGFDVRFRFDDRIENRIETIETYTIEEVTE